MPLSCLLGLLFAPLMLAGMLVFDGGDVGWLFGFAARVVEDGLKVVAARLWLIVDVLLVVVLMYQNTKRCWVMEGFG